MSAPRPLDAQLIEWLRKRIAHACDVRESIAMARQFGYSDDVIAAGIDAARPLGSVLADGRMQPPPLIRRAPPNLAHLGTPQLELYTLDAFLDPADCERVIELSLQSMAPSTVAHDYGDPHVRISQTAFLGHTRDPLAAQLDDRICRTLGIRAAYSEGIQAQRYEVGGHFKPHCDYFSADADVHRSACSVRGNRTWTFMVYLDDAMEGGATRFTEIHRVIRPKTGMAVLWNNLHVDGSPNPASRHCGEPVTRGHKTIITKWFRMRGDGPVFHD